MTNALTHWKTTLIGAGIAALTAVQTYTGHDGWKGYVAAALIAALGFFAKDFNK